MEAGSAEIPAPKLLGHPAEKEPPDVFAGDAEKPRPPGPVAGAAGFEALDVAADRALPEVDHERTVPDLGQGFLAGAPRVEDTVEILGAGADAPVPEDNERGPEKGARRIGVPFFRALNFARPVVKLLHPDVVEGQALELAEKGLLRCRVDPPVDVRKIDELEDRRRLLRARFALEFQEAPDVAHGLFEHAVDADGFIGRLVVAVDGESELVEAAYQEAARFLLVEERAVGVEFRDDPRVVGIADDLEEVGVQQGFAAVGEVRLGDEAGGLVDDLREKAEVHGPLFFPGQVLVRAHDALEIAEARGFDPQAKGEVRQNRPPPFIGEEDLRETAVVGSPGHLVLDRYYLLVIITLPFLYPFST